MTGKGGIGSKVRRAASAATCILVIFAAFVALLTVSSGLVAAAELSATDFKIAGDATRTRAVISFNAEPDPQWKLLRSPHRLVIDLPRTRFTFDRKSLKARGLVRDATFGNVAKDRSRIILTMKGPFAIGQAEVAANEDGKGFRLAIDLATASHEQFDAALADQAATTASTTVPKGDPAGQPAPAAAKPFTVVIDAGHGGIDGGANGVSGTVEKNITLAFAKELRDRLAGDSRYAVHMTREGDQFLRLDDRVRIARENAADLFISVHADTINMKGIRGATVYTVSDRASDAESQALADRENLSDQLAGIDIADQNHEVADILADLIRRETHAFSIRFARTLVGELSDSVGLINNPHRYAGFKVLRAPDVPSVLVELGYLSNAKDEEQLSSPEWRGKAVTSIANAIAEFAATKAVGG